MAMKNPPHVGETVWHDIIEPLDLSVTEAAKALGVTRQSLSLLINGRTALSSDMALRIAKVTGTNYSKRFLHLIFYQFRFYFFCIN